MRNDDDSSARPSVAHAITRGLVGRCPACGRGRMLAGYIAPVAACAACGEDLTPYRTADLAPYLVTFLIGFTFIPAAFVLSLKYGFAGWIVWVLMAGALAVAALALPRAKGAAIGLLWALDVRG